MSSKDFIAGFTVPDYVATPPEHDCEHEDQCELDPDCPFWAACSLLRLDDDE
jgi:hypothetical protein